MITKANKELAKWTQDFALKNGCEAARVVLYNGESNTVEIRDRKIDRLHQAAEICDNAEIQALHTSERIRENAREEIADLAVEIASRVLEREVKKEDNQDIIDKYFNRVG